MTATHLPEKTILSEQRRQHVGWLAVFGSALCFYLATTIISWGSPYARTDAGFYTFARFILGFAIVCATMAIKGQRPSCTHVHSIIGRTVTNALAVFCFYKAVDVSSVVTANILNMTYPLFVALFSWFLMRSQRDVVALGIVAFASLGIWLILGAGTTAVQWENYWGLLSGFFAGFSILYLNFSRQFHDSQTILFYMFGLGALLIVPFSHDSLFIPNK
jgi:drug/metabolite transporter (DMT)-like permease